MFICFFLLYIQAFQSCFVQTCFPGQTAAGSKQILERKEKMGSWFILAAMPTIIMEKNFFFAQEL